MTNTIHIWPHKNINVIGISGWWQALFWMYAGRLQTMPCFGRQTMRPYMIRASMLDIKYMPSIGNLERLVQMLRDIQGKCVSQYPVLLCGKGTEYRLFYQKGGSPNTPDPTSNLLRKEVLACSYTARSYKQHALPLEKLDAYIMSAWLYLQWASCCLSIQFSLAKITPPFSCELDILSQASRAPCGMHGALGNVYL